MFTTLKNKLHNISMLHIKKSSSGTTFAFAYIE